MMTFAEIIAQSPTDIYYYYVEEQNVNDLLPVDRVRHSNDELSLSFDDNELSKFFIQNKTYSYHKAFPGAINRKLTKTYILGLERDDLLDNLQAINKIKKASYIGTLEDEVLSITPNDYSSNVNIPTQVENEIPILGLPNEHLELVNARRAWNITTSNPNIKIGVLDGPFNINHEDLENKITTHYGTTSLTGSFGSPHQHGTKVAGIAAQETNNNLGLAGIGYNSTLVTGTTNFQLNPSLPHPFDNVYGLPARMLYIVINNPDVKVITHSRIESCSYIEEHALVYQEIWEEYGVTPITAAGNGNWKAHCPDPQGGRNGYLYPASYDHVISISTVGHHFNYGTDIESGNAYGWKDVHEFIINNVEFTFTHNDEVDLVAPGYHVPMATGDDFYLLGAGTSYSGPFVAGVASLMYDVYPNITPSQVKNILKNTADDIYHIPENEQYEGLLGSGRVNAYAAVLQAKCLADGNPSGLDLTMQNSSTDYGDEPDTETDVIWNSPDIWVRNNPDGFLYKESEDLHYQGTNSTAYVYVRITNDSCETSSGNDLLELYWAKGGLSQQWPNVWKGFANTGLLDIGNEVGIQNIPELAPGASTILEFEWTPGNPEAYENLGFEKPWMFCFLARIESAADPMTFAETSSAATNASNNNNIAYKNETIINVSSRPSKGSVVVGNLGGQNALNSSVEFFTTTSLDHNIWQEAEVRAELNEDLWDLWQNSGAQSTAVRVINPSDREIMIMDNGASLDNILFLPSEWGIATMSVNFLINEVGAQDEFTFHVQQYDSSNLETLGGFTYTFNRDNQRAMFSAVYSSSTNNDNTETLYASLINEEAIYNWYDQNGNLVYSGSDYTVNSLVAKKYKLEVIAEEDGHKDYREVETEDKRKITLVSPNPASTNIQVEYLISPNDNAYIMVTNSVTGVNHNFILNNQTNAINIPLQNFISGAYVINLVIEGNIIDAKHIIKQ